MVVRARQLDPGGIYQVVFPDESIFQMTDEAAKREMLAAHVRSSYTNFTHFGCQCKMGRTIDDGVVDGFLNVFGTRNLKVADLSVAPILPDGNTSTGAQVIGLNAARFLLGDLEDEDCESRESSSIESSSFESSSSESSEYSVCCESCESCESSESEDC